MLKLFETLPLISLDCCHELNCDDQRGECDDTEKEQQLAKDLMSPKIDVAEGNYCKCITFGDVFFLAPLAVVSIRQIKYIAKCAFIKV